MNTYTEVSENEAKQCWINGSYVFVVSDTNKLGAVFPLNDYIEEYKDRALSYSPNNIPLDKSWNFFWKGSIENTAWGLALLEWKFRHYIPNNPIKYFILAQQNTRRVIKCIQ